MEHESMKYHEEEFEDGELSDSNDSYTPLQRPNTSTVVKETASSLPTSLVSNVVTKMEDASELEESLGESDSDSGSDCDFSSRNRPNKKKVVKLKPRQGIQIPGTQSSRFHQNKFNIWSTSLQEEVMENLKGCGVDQDSGRYDRSCESYDYSLKYRLNGGNSLKRRQSYSDDSDKGLNSSSSNANESKNKRFRANSLSVKDRRNVRLRIGNPSDESSSNDSSAIMNMPRCISDLSVTMESTNDEIARAIANKLYEEKDDLMIRVVNVLGPDLPIKLFKETQKIESDGGMLIVNGMRRRTPGGVFLFLLKNCDDISKKQKKDIFLEETRKTIKGRKHAQATKRDQEVEKLKKTLKNENDLPVLATRSDILVSTTSHLRLDSTHANLSNPPPSPVTDCNRENSSDFDTHCVQPMVNVTSLEKDYPRASNSAVTYDDDILSVNCDDMDLF